MELKGKSCWIRFGLHVCSRSLSAKAKPGPGAGWTIGDQPYLVGLGIGLEVGEGGGGSQRVGSYHSDAKKTREMSPIEKETFGIWDWLWFWGAPLC